MNEITPYVPRTFHHNGLWTIDGVMLKAYLITLTGQPQIPANTLASAKKYLALTLPAMRALEGELTRAAAFGGCDEVQYADGWMR